MFCSLHQTSLGFQMIFLCCVYYQSNAAVNSIWETIIDNPSFSEVGMKY